MPALRAVAYREIPGHHGYRVGDDGTVWSCVRANQHGRALTGRWRQLKPRPAGGANRNYFQVCLGRGCREYVHHLVLLTFVGPRPPGTEACHDPDRNPRNNRLENLRWDTRSANHLDMNRHDNGIRGEKNPAAKLDEKTVRLIRRLRREGLGVTRIACALDLCRPTVNSIVHGPNWKHVSA